MKGAWEFAFLYINNQHELMAYESDCASLCEYRDNSLCRIHLVAVLSPNLTSPSSNTRISGSIDPPARTMANLKYVSTSIVTLARTYRAPTLARWRYHCH